MCRCNHLHTDTRTSQATSGHVQSNLFLAWVQIKKEEKYEEERTEEPPTTLQRRNPESEEQLSVPHFSQVTLDDHFKNGR